MVIQKIILLIGEITGGHLDLLSQASLLFTPKRLQCQTQKIISFSRLSVLMLGQTHAYSMALVPMAVIGHQMELDMPTIQLDYSLINMDLHLAQ